MTNVNIEQLQNEVDRLNFQIHLAKQDAQFAVKKANDKNEARVEALKKARHDEQGSAHCRKEADEARQRMESLQSRLLEAQGKLNQAIHGFPPHELADPAPRGQAELSRLRAELVRVKQERDEALSRLWEPQTMETDLSKGEVK